MTVKLTLHGTRGQLPALGSWHTDFGGATSTYEVTGPAGRLIFDAGTGLVALGKRLVAEATGPQHVDLVLSHAHLDHIMGLPFFAPLFQAHFSVRILSCDAALDTPMEAALKAYWGSPYCPVALSHFKASLKFETLAADEEVEIGSDMSLRATALHHPGGNAAFRLTVGGKSLVYSGDFEHGDAASDARLHGLLDGADLALLDCNYTPQTYEAAKGFGHAHWQAAGELARGANKWLGVHHSHGATDSQLHEIEADLRAAFPNGALGRDGQVLDL